MGELLAQGPVTNSCPPSERLEGGRVEVFASPHFGVKDVEVCPHKAVVVKTNGIPCWLLGEFTTQFRTYSGWIPLFHL